MIQWHVHAGGETIGPFDRPTLKLMVGSGQITLEDFYWNDEAWRPLSELFPAGHVPSAPGSTDPIAAMCRRFEAHIPKAVDDRDPAPFVCDSCGTIHAIKKIIFAHGSRLCHACHSGGRGKYNAAVTDEENPLEAMLLRRAPLWALLLIVIPFLSFRFVADLINPMKAFPPYYPPIKQSIAIYESVIKLSKFQEAYAIKEKLLPVAEKASAAAFASTPEEMRAPVYAMHLLILEASGKNDAAVKFMIDHPTPPPADQTQHRKFIELEARILAAAGDSDLALKRVSVLAERQEMEKMSAAYGHRPQMTPTGFLAGIKEYDQEIRNEVYELIDDRGSVVVAALMRMIAKAPEQNQAAGGYDRENIERRLVELEALLPFFVQAEDTFGKQIMRNASASSDAVLNELVRVAATHQLKMTRREARPQGSGGIDVSIGLEGRTFGSIVSFFQETSSEKFKYFGLARRFSAQSRQKQNWRIDVNVHFPLPGKEFRSADIREKIAALRIAARDTDPQRISLSSSAAERLTSDLNTEKRRLEDLLKSCFPQLNEILRALPMVSLISVNSDARNLNLQGESTGSVSYNSVKQKMKPFVERHALSEDENIDVRTQNGKEITFWRLQYQSRSY